MAVLNVSEYATVLSPGGLAMIPAGQPLASYDIIIDVASASGPPLQPGTKMVRLNCDISCRVALGPAGSVQALATSGRFTGGATEYWGVLGGGQAVAAISSS